MKNGSEIIAKGWNSLVELAYPSRCIGCGRVAALGNERDRELIRRFWFCHECVQNLVVSFPEQCPRCGALDDGSENVPASDGKSRNRPGELHVCPHCFPNTFKFERIVALGNYDGLLRHLVLKTKNDYGGLTTRSLTDLLYQNRKELLQEFSADMVVPVPMYWFRYLRRGVCATFEMASRLGACLQIPACQIVRRVRNTSLQWELGPQERKRNVQGAFSLRPANLFLSRVPDLTGKRIILADDIVTTGVTCNEIAKLLHLSGASSVMVATFSRATGVDRAGQK